MASITKRGSRWRVRVRRQGYPVQTRTFAKKSDADAWARQLETEMDGGEWRDRSEAQRTTLGELLQRYRNEVTPTRKGSVREGYIIGMWRRHPLAARSLASLRSQDFASWRDHRLTEVKPSTVQRELAVVSAAFERARKDWGIYCPNPTRDVSVRVGHNARDRRVSDEEIARLLEAAKRGRVPFTALMIRWAVATAMRRGEIVSLLWVDVDTKRRTARLHETKAGVPRTVPLSSEALAVLDEAKKLINKKSKDGRVFPISANAARLGWERCRRRAGLRDIRFHDLRHEAVSRLFERGLNLIEVASISGHQDLRTLKRYTHPDPEALAKRLG